MENNQKCDKSRSIPAEGTIRAKRMGDSPLHSELGKKRREEGESEGGFMQSVSRHQKSKAKVPTNKDKRKGGGRRRTLLIKPTEDKTLVAESSSN